MKIAIFWDKIFENNNFRNLEFSKNLSPFNELARLNGFENTISSDLLDSREDKEDFIILCFLNVTVSNILQYVRMFRKYPKNKKYFFAFEPEIIARFNYNRIFHYFFEKVYTWNDDLIDNKKYLKYFYPSSLRDINDFPRIDFSQKKFISLINSNKIAI
jgi:hypothetical protein